MKKILYPLFLFTILFAIGCEVGVSQSITIEGEKLSYGDRKNEVLAKLRFLINVDKKIKTDFYPLYINNVRIGEIHFSNGILTIVKKDWHSRIKENDVSTLFDVFFDVSKRVFGRYGSVIENNGMYTTAKSNNWLVFMDVDEIDYQIKEYKTYFIIEKTDKKPMMNVGVRLFKESNLYEGESVYHIVEYFMPIY